MSTITTRSGKGSALSHAEADANFTNLNTDKAEVADLASTANGKGASTIGIEDSGGIVTATTVEGAIQEDVANLNTHIADTTTHGTTGDIVGTSDTQTLTNKTIAYASNTMTGLIIGTDIQAYSATLGKVDQTVFTSSGTWTKDAGLAYVIVEVIGAGGSGGRNSAAGGGGAGAGGYSRKFIAAASLGATETVTVGTGGAAVTTDVTGNTGGTSSFGAHASATGGAGGNTNGNSGLAGVGSGGDINYGLGDGDLSVTTAAAVAVGGGGGGYGGRGGTLGAAGKGPGGGGGGSSTGDSGAGYDGIVIVTEFYQ